MDKQKKHEVKMTPKRIKFMQTYNDYDDSQTLKELLFANQLQLEKLDKLEKIRSNTSVLVWWLIVIPLVLGILIFLFGLGRL
ncbi:hypothetical protein [Psychroserpens jangbogonensis]|uniref:hypothetical protein n=1 Tax=Psychroserpens jangbogonensis TaxID=1484460 RepID=UPI00053ECE92|nr:hypothetical protein [Psychroserpens jangbogonensis]